MKTKPNPVTTRAVTNLDFRRDAVISRLIPLNGIDYTAAAAIASKIPTLDNAAPLTEIAAACGVSVGRANRIFREFVDVDAETIRHVPGVWNVEISEAMTGDRNKNRSPLYQVIPTVGLMLYFKTFTPKRKHGDIMPTTNPEWAAQKRERATW